MRVCVCVCVCVRGTPKNFMAVFQYQRDVMVQKSNPSLHDKPVAVWSNVVITIKKKDISIGSASGGIEIATVSWATQPQLYEHSQQLSLL